MLPSLHRSGGDGGGSGGACCRDRLEGGGGWRRWNEMERRVESVMAWCRRKPHWPTVLAVLGVGWLVATLLTGFGMYMVICHTPTQRLVLTPHGREMVTQVVTEEFGGGSGVCGGTWTLREGQVTLILGCLLNGVVLALMLFNMFIDRRRPHTCQIVPEHPPDYETLIKEETPPPSYAELDLASSSSSSSSSPSPTPTTSTSYSSSSSSPSPSCAPPSYDQL